MTLKLKLDFEKTDINMAHNMDICYLFTTVLILFETFLWAFMLNKTGSFKIAEEARKKTAKIDQEEGKIVAELIKTLYETVPDPESYDDVLETLGIA